MFNTHVRVFLLKKEKILLVCLKFLLEPIAAFCLTHSLRIQDLTESAKQSLILKATNKLEKESIEPTISRLSVMTGIHRRDVVRIFKEGNTHSARAGVVHRVLGVWEQHSDYLGENGLPRKLLVKGDKNEFRELVFSLSQDVDPSTVLFELLRVGAVKEEGDFLILTADAYVNNSDPVEAYQMLSQDMSDLSEAVEENLWGSLKTPNLHAQTEYINISAQDLPRIRLWLLEKGSEFHRNTRDYLSRFDRDINPQMRTGKKARVVLGTFSRITEEGES